MTIQFPSFGSFDPLRRAGDRLQRSYQRLSTGRRINSAADDASGLSIVERLRALESAANQGVHNLASGSNLLQVAEGGLDRISDNLGRMRELAIQARNGTLSDSDRELIQIEYDQLADEVSRTANSTEFNGRSLLDGSTSGTGAVTIHDGTGGQDLEVEFADHSAGALGIEGLAVDDDATVAALDQAIDTVASSRGGIGATQNRIDTRIQDLRQRSLNLADAGSRIADASIAAEASELIRAKLLGRAGIALQSHQRLSSGAVLDLLG